MELGDPVLSEFSSPDDLSPFFLATSCSHWTDEKTIWSLGNKIILIKTIVLPSSIGKNSGSQRALAPELTHSNALSINTSLQHFPGTAEPGTEASPRPAKFLLAEPPQSSAQK